MIKKFGFWVLLNLLLYSVIMADVFIPPNFTLGGHMPISNNKPDFYNQPKGISLSEDHSYYLDSMNSTVKYEVDYENSVVKLSVYNGKHQLANPIYISFDNYLDNIPAAVFEKEFEKLRLQNLTASNRVDSKGLIPEIVIKLPPIAMPRAIRRIMGSKAGSLSLTGSAKITIGASRTQRETNLATEYGDNTNFDIMMKQDINANLKGTIGEKITVNVRFNSNQETSVFDPNNIHIAYTGDEDEIVQSIEAGNTSLSLSGSRYISVSASSQGLFGVKGIFKLGDLSITAIASKEEAQKNSRTYTGGASSESSSIASRNFAKRQQYYIENPRFLFDMYRVGDNCPPSWVNNAIKTNEWGQWYVSSPYLLPTAPAPGNNAVLKVYHDDDSASTNRPGVTITGVSMYDPDSNWWSPANSTYSFDELVENVDYYIDYTAGIITFIKRIEQTHSLGIAYTRQSGQQIGNITATNVYSDSLGIREEGIDDSTPPADMFYLKPLKLRNQTSASPTWPLERRNIYDLGMRNVGAEGFLLEVYSAMSNTERNIQLPDSLVTSGISTFNDYLRLDTDGNGIINGDDATVNLQMGNIVLPFIEPFRGLWNDDENRLYETDSNNSDPNLYFYIEGRIGRDQISLGMMILPGSVTVKVNGKTLAENIDYLVDYDFGQVTFLSSEGKDPNASIEINYENRPMFAIESKTLLGMRADWKPTDKFKLGGTIIYQSETITDKRPKIGNESRSMVLADIDGEVGVDLPFLTKIVDFLPLVKTDTMSRITLSGEIAMNAPRIIGSDAFGDGKEAWLDDMESVIDSYPLGITRSTWVPASETDRSQYLKGKLNWFNPNTVYNKDVYAEGTLSENARNESISVLDLKILTPPDKELVGTTRLFGGLQKYIGNQVDFSEKEYIELLVKVESQEPNNDVKFFLDLGEVSEDFYTEYGGENVLNTEDGSDGSSPNGRLDRNEDRGLDGKYRGEIGADPDDYFWAGEVNGEFPNINGTEANGILDTEDLNDNGRLDTQEKWIRYTTPLNQYSPYMQSQYNGWQLFRIPLKNNDEIETTGTDTYSSIIDKVSYVRMWYTADADVKIRIVYVDIIGNKWEDMQFRKRNDVSSTIADSLVVAEPGEYISVGTVDNQKTVRYEPPPKSTEKGNDDEDSFEQSLFVKYENLQPGHIALVRQKFREAFNLLSYNKLRYYVYIESEGQTRIQPNDLKIVFRVGADSLNYYEISTPYTKDIKSTSDAFMSVHNWQEIEIDYPDITLLKTEGIHTDDYDNTFYTKGNTEYRMIKKPTLSNTRELEIGIFNESDQPFSGVVYFNEIRVAEPNQNIGFAARATMDTRFADFSTLRVDYEWKTSDFYTSTSRNTANTALEDKYSINVTNNYTVDKLFPLTWGLRLPLNMSYNYSVGKPKYQTNSDVIRTNLSDTEKERDQNRAEARQADITYSMTRTPPSKIVEYTLKNLTAGANFREQMNVTATRSDTVYTYRYNGAYNLTIPQESLRLKIFGDYYFYYLPKVYTNSANLRGELPKRYDWYIPAATDTLNTEPFWRPRISNAQTVNTKLIETSNDIRYDILTDLTSSYKLTTKRDLIEQYLVKNINLGVEKERSQDVQLQYTPFYTTYFMNTQISATSSYRETRNTSTYQDSVRVAFNGNTSRSIRTTVTLKNSELLSKLANTLGASSNKRFQANTRESGIDFSGLDDSGGKDDMGMGDFGKGDFGGDDIGKGDFFNDFPSPDDKKPETGREGSTLIDRGRDQGRGRPDLDRGRERGKDEIKDREDGGETDKDASTQTQQSSSGSSFQLSSIFAEVFGFMARVQNISVGYENTENSTYANRDASKGRPNFKYQLGIDQRIEDVQNKGLNDSYTVSTGFPIIKNLVCDTRYAFAIQRSYQPETGSRSKNTNQVWPDVRLSYAGLETIIKADKLITSSRLQTAYNLSERLSYGGANWNDPDTQVLTHTFGPLLGWNTNWVNNITSSLAANLTLAENNSGLNSPTTRTNTSQRIAYTGTVGYSFTGEHGLKFPFIKKRFFFQNQVQSDLSVSYETEIRKTIGNNEQESIEYDADKLIISPRISYSFHKNVKGGLTGTYELNADKASDVNLNIFRLEFWIEVIF